MRIIVDAMGGDNAPFEIVKGSLEASVAFGVDVLLCGREEAIRSVGEQLGHTDFPSSVEVVNASEIIDMDDDPAKAVRIKKDSSLTVALNLLRDKQGDALVSAGNTGALLSGATLLVKRVRGVRRAALAPCIPNMGNGFVLIDSGANVECTPEYLMQFAIMGSCYARNVLGVLSPRVGLLNNGSEKSKGTSLQLEAYSLLTELGSNEVIDFIGNVEAKDAMKGVCDVLVCDGFTGNVFLKSIEGMGSFILSELKSIYTKNLISKLSALVIKKSFYGLRNRLDSDTIGGTALLGISMPVIKAHGGSSAMAITAAIKQAIVAVESDFSKHLAESLNASLKSVDK